MLLRRRQYLTFNSIQDTISSIPLSVIRDIFLIAASASILFVVANNTITKNRNETEDNVKNSIASANIIRSADYQEFKWSAYANPDNPVFFDEGEGHIPPRPYIYLAQHPTLENAIKLQEWQRKKLEITNKVTDLLIAASKPMDVKKLISFGPQGLGEYIAQKNEAKSEIISSEDKNKQSPLQLEDPFKVTASDFKNVSILYFYRSDCVHCQNTKPTIDKLLSLGVSVIPVQIDYKVHSPEYKNSIPYDPQLASVYPVTETPNFVLKVGTQTRSFKGEITPSQLAKVISLIKEKKG